jgi:hypothetical protein
LYRTPQLLVEQRPKGLRARDNAPRHVRIERAFALQPRDFVVGRAARLTKLASKAANMAPESL